MAQSQRERLRRAASTRNIRDFKFMVRSFRTRVNIVSEGDSWFDYPRKYIVGGKSANIMDHIQRWARGKANLLRLSSNGDEATQMLSGEQRHKLSKLLSDCTRTKDLNPVDLLLFSGGGNDVVGSWDLPRFIEKRSTAHACIQWGRLNRKMRQLELALEELVELCDEYSPSTVVVTHTYDRIFPSDKGAEFLGIKWTKSWIKPYLVEKGIDSSLYREVSDLLLLRVRDRLVALAEKPRLKDRLFVVETTGTLTTKGEWLNEIHPTSKGFKKVAKKVYKKMRALEPRLPAP